MSFRPIARIVVGGYVKVLRWPLDRAAQMFGRGAGGGASGAEIAVDRVDAAARDVAGKAMGDEQLQREAGRKRASADERARARRLRTNAEAGSKRADKDLAETRERATRQRAQAAERAQRKRKDADAARKAAERKAAEVERKRLAASEQAAEQAEEQLGEREQRARLAQLENEAEALAERETALTTADEAQRLGDAAARAKAARKAD